MRKVSITMIAILLFVQILSNGFAQIPNTDNNETLDTVVDIPSQTSARNNSSGNNTGGNNNSSNCGNYSNLTDMVIWSDAATYTVGDTVYMGYDVNCTIIGNNYTIDSWLRNTTTVLYGGSPWFGWTAQWNPMQFYDYNANFDAGDYCLNATLYEDGTFLEFEETCFTIVSATGNGTGNNTGGNNSSNCGNDSNLTDLMVWTDATTYTVGDSVFGNFFVNCTVIGETYQLDYEVVEYNTNIEHADGEWNWTALNNWESFNPTWTGLPAGNYCIHSTLVIWTGTAYSFVDFVSSCFDVMNSTTGGNNTGGNNTGGNNTGGNNTGGNNTGGNNTGGNNTGGNNTSCMSSMQIVDGSVNITGVNSVYNMGDQFNGNLITCWIPSNTSMSLTAWLNSSGGSNYDIQVHSGSWYWPTWTGAQNMGTDGYWMFPINTQSSMYGTVDYSSLNLPVGDYCWEALFKVFDSGIFMPVDTDISCFTISSNNTGGNNTGGNNTGGNNSTNPCGNNSSLLSVFSWTDGLIYQSWDNQELSFYVNCTIIGNDYTLEYYVTEVGVTTWWSYAGSWTWTAGQTYSSFTDIISGLGEGDYCVIGNLNEYGTYATDDGGNTCFTILAANNTAPQISSVIIAPSSPTESNVLTCSYSYSDLDNDPDLSGVTWTINGVSTTTAGSVLSTGYTTGDFVTCVVAAYDGTDYGNIGSTTVLIMSNSNGSSSGGSGGLPSIGVAGTIAAISAGFIFATRREDEE